MNRGISGSWQAATTAGRSVSRGFLRTRRFVRISTHSIAPWASVLALEAVNCRQPRRESRPHPAQIPLVSQRDNGASRAHPAGGRRRLPQAPAEPRKARLGKPCSRLKAPPIPAQPGTTKTGLSRRRSRVRVPSLPSSFARPSNFCRREGPGSGPLAVRSGSDRGARPGVEGGSAELRAQGRDGRAHGRVAKARV